MGSDCVGWHATFSLPTLLREVLRMSRPILPLHRLFYGGLLGVLLSVIFAEYTSISLFNLYHNSYFIRDTTGSSPNHISGILLKFSWAVLCLTSWLMIWKLDFFLARQPPLMPPPVPDLKDDTPTPSSSLDETSTPEADPLPQEEKESGKKENAKIKEEEFAKQSLQDLHFAKILEIKDISDMANIKSSYRQKIAQYHPDRVRAMGPEIREIAESKAKEINEAHEYFRKKFKTLE